MKKEMVVCFAFGRGDFSPVNFRLGLIAEREARRRSASVICTQEDVLLPKLPEVETHLVPDKDGQPPSTLDIAREAVSLARFWGIGQIHLVAAFPHLERCMRDIYRVAEEMGYQLRVRISPAVLHAENRGFRWFWSCSEQVHTRYRAIWFLREVVLHILPWSLYTRLTGREE